MLWQFKHILVIVEPTTVLLVLCLVDRQVSEAALGPRDRLAESGHHSPGIDAVHIVGYLHLHDRVSSCAHLPVHALHRLPLYRR